jgi:hypothetical protein
LLVSPLVIGAALLGSCLLAGRFVLGRLTWHCAQLQHLMILLDRCRRIADMEERQMNEQAEAEIKARQDRMRNVPLDYAPVSWMREIADELTRLRYAVVDATKTNGPKT